MVPKYVNPTGPGQYEIKSTIGSKQLLEKFKNEPSFVFGIKNPSMEMTY